MTDKLRLGITLDEDLTKAFRAEKRKTLATNAALARVALVEYLRKRGHDVQDNVMWGGSDPAPAESEPRTPAARAR